MSICFTLKVMRIPTAYLRGLGAAFRRVTAACFRQQSSWACCSLQARRSLVK